MSAPAQPFVSPEQYLEIERASELRHDYFNGQMYAMSGGTFRHAKIISNMGSLLHAMLKDRSCDVLMNDLRTFAAGLYTYPDIVAVCGEPQFEHDRTDTLANPTVLVEVLSPSTERYDRGIKSAQYRQIQSLREFALVSQIEPRIEVFRRQSNGGWMLFDYIGLEATCRFESIECEIALADIYARVTFDAAEQARAAIPPTE